MADNPPIRRALLSVSDKSGLTEFGAALVARGVGLISTGGTATALRAAGLEVGEVADVTGFPEMLDGRVKTLHPAVHGGILARRDIAAHQSALADNDIAPIDLVVVNLYPFEQTIAADAHYEACVEQIDIGGPALIRAAAKNHDWVTVVVDPTDYERVLDDIARHDGAVSRDLRRVLAAKAFGRTAAYDSAIARWFGEVLDTPFPEWWSVAGRRRQVMRYGENPHQAAAFYSLGDHRPGAATAEQVQGKDLSYNNLADADAAFELVAEFDPPAVAIIKHANPCGVALDASGDLAKAHAAAKACDPVSAFGGIVALNREIDEAAAKAITEIFTEVVIAPAASEAARAVFAAKKNLRLLLTGAMPDPASATLTARTLSGGLLVQDRDAGRVDAGELKTVSARAPSEAEIADMVFAFTVAKHVKSNAIIYAKAGATVGIGAGQMSRVDSARIAAHKAEAAATDAGEDTRRTEGAVVASDAFFPFADGLIAAAAAGVTAVIQPGGSVRDDEVIAAADERGLAMVFTGQRHFRH